MTPKADVPDVLYPYSSNVTHSVEVVIRKLQWESALHLVEHLSNLTVFPLTRLPEREPR